MAAAAQRKRGGGAFGGAKTKENNGEQEGGTFKKLDKDATVAKLGTKTSSDGFKRGGAKRASGGRTDADGINREPGSDDDEGRKAGGAVGKKAGGAVAKKAGGAISGGASAPSLGQRARGGRTSAPFSTVHAPSARHGSSSSGHEGE
jgi:hypothetical protein